MQWRNTAERYGFVACALHWIIVAGVIAQYFLAEAGHGDEGSPELMALHVSIGFTLLALAALRLAWRAIDRQPAPPAKMKRRDVILARAVHGAFYLLLFALPLSGWMLTSLEGETISFFGSFTIPPLPGAAAEETVEEVHEALFNVLVALAVVHLAAGLKHHFIDRDDVLLRMAPWA